MNRSLRRTSGLAALALTATMGFAACSSDDSGGSTASDTSSSTSSPSDDMSSGSGDATDAGAQTFGAGCSSIPSDGITVFAPTDDAFAKIPKKSMNAVMADKKTLTKILTYHVVPGQLTPDQLAGTHKTLEGEDLTVKGSGEDFTVGSGGAKVLCGNIPTANATVYVIDSVLMP